MARASGKRRDRTENVKPTRRSLPARAVDIEANRRDITDYFEARRERLEIVATTRTPSGQMLDWVPIESQPHYNPKAKPPPEPERVAARRRSSRKEELAGFELHDPRIERGPAGTVPVRRPDLSALSFRRPLRQHLSKTRGHRMLTRRGTALAMPEEDGQHRYASSGQQVLCWGGEAQLSCFDPWVESSDDFSLIQIGLSNSDLGFMQTVEAGWQEFQDLTGDWVPHLFLFYTTNGYSDEGDGKGGYNTDVDGWVQYDGWIYPGATFTPYSDRGGAQRMISIKFQMYNDNWWFRCQDRWLGYYPSSLFMGNQHIFSTLGDHADHIGFWGEIFDSDDVDGRTTTDMGSGNWPEQGWTWSAYMHNLRYQSDRSGGMTDYDGSAEVWRSDPDMYDIDPHFNSGEAWGSYQYLGGPGAG